LVQAKLRRLRKRDGWRKRNIVFTNNTQTIPEGVLYIQNNIKPTIVLKEKVSGHVC
jgi:hypothetical protein